MSVSIEDITIVNPKASFSDPIIFDITFQSTIAIDTYIRWEVIYMCSPTSAEHDQILASVRTGPIKIGLSRFVLKSEPPTFESILIDEMELTGAKLIAYYKDQEFFSLGYYVINKLPEDWEQTQNVSSIQRERFQDEDVHITTIKWP
jgi:hypothetical protein